MSPDLTLNRSAGPCVGWCASGFKPPSKPFKPYVFDAHGAPGDLRWLPEVSTTQINMFQSSEILQMMFWNVLVKLALFWSKMSISVFMKSMIWSRFEAKLKHFETQN